MTGVKRNGKMHKGIEVLSLCNDVAKKEIMEENW